MDLAGRDAATGYGLAIIVREVLARTEQTVAARRPQSRGTATSAATRRDAWPMMGARSLARLRRLWCRRQSRRDRHRRARPPRRRLPQDHRLQGGRRHHERATPDHAGGHVLIPAAARLRRLRPRPGEGRAGPAHRRGRQRPHLARRPMRSSSSGTSTSCRMCWRTPEAWSSAISEIGPELAAFPLAPRADPARGGGASSSRRSATSTTWAQTQRVSPSGRRPS